MSHLDRIPQAAPASVDSAVYIFPTADAMIRALGLEDPDPVFTELYHAAHVENSNRDASAAFERVSEHVKVMNARWRNR